MTRDEVLEMARKAGFVEYELDDGTLAYPDIRYVRFAALVAERTARQVPPDCVVVPRETNDEMIRILATPGNYRRYQDQWEALIAAGEVK